MVSWLAESRDRATAQEGAGNLFESQSQGSDDSLFLSRLKENIIF